MFLSTFLELISNSLHRNIDRGCPNLSLPLYNWIYGMHSKYILLEQNEMKYVNVIQ